MYHCVLKTAWSTLKPVILAEFLTGANTDTRTLARSGPLPPAWRLHLCDESATAPEPQP